MNAPPNTLTVSERADVHKSCKSLEVVVNLLNDYCEAAGAVVLLQKKLTKAVRETANLKSTPEAAANTLGACAVLLEALSDVDSKFAKLADKECESLSTDVRKWFKKLAKEEKAHDDRIAQASAKLKQAGLSYEKKAKKNPRDATEEHSRYLTLVGTLGPEMTQDKYNHAVFVSQKHASVTLGVAACLARITDGEWLRSCENVRRFAPTVGQIGEWRAYCEGGWTGSRPQVLPLTSEALLEPNGGHPSQRPSSRHDDRPPSRNEQSFRSDPRPVSRNEQLSTRGSHGDSEDQHGSSHQSNDLTPLEIPESSENRRTSQPASPAIREGEPPVSGVDQTEPVVSPIEQQDRAPANLPESPRKIASPRPSATSLASLAAFPSPPTHFPIPSVSTPTGHRQSPSLSGNSTPNTSSLSNGSDSSQQRPPRSARPSSVGFATMPRLAESPQHEPLLEESLEPSSDRKAPVGSYPFPHTSDSGTPEEKQSKTPETREEAPRSGYSPAPPYAEPTVTSPIEPLSPADTGTALSSTPSGSQSGHGAMMKRGDYLNDREFGVERPTYGQGSKSMDAIKNRGIQRNDTGQSATSTSGSMVAAIRGRYSHSTSPASPPTRDVPKLSQSVTEIANKYRAPELASPAPLRRTTSPPNDLSSSRDRPPSAYRLSGQWADPQKTSLNASTSSRTDFASSTSSLHDDLARRRQRLDELEELELREREYDLRQKERELERERARIAAARGGGGPEGYNGETGNTLTRDQLSGAGAMNTGRPRLSSSATHLNTPSSSSRTASSVQPQTPVATSGSGPHEPHASYCGCASCSATKYGRQEHPPSAHDLRPPEPPIQLRQEKPKGWMRRLSMPVGAAFSLNDAKRATAAVSSNAMNRNSMSFTPTPEDERGSRARNFDAKSPANRSVTNLGRR